MVAGDDDVDGLNCLHKVVDPVSGVCHCHHHTAVLSLSHTPHRLRDLHADTHSHARDAPEQTDALPPALS